MTNQILILLENKKFSSKVASQLNNKVGFKDKYDFLKNSDLYHLPELQGSHQLSQKYLFLAKHSQDKQMNEFYHDVESYIIKMIKYYKQNNQDFAVGIVPDDDILAIDIDGLPHFDKSIKESTFNEGIAKEVAIALGVKEITMQKTTGGIHLFAHINHFSTENSQFNGLIQTKNGVMFPIFDVTTHQIKYIKADIRCAGPAMKPGIIAIYKPGKYQDFITIKNEFGTSNTINHDIFDKTYLDNINADVPDASLFIDENNELNTMIKSYAKKPVAKQHKTIAKVTPLKVHHKQKKSTEKIVDYESVGLKPDCYTQFVLDSIDMAISTLKSNITRFNNAKDFEKGIYQRKIELQVPALDPQKSNKDYVAERFMKLMDLLSKLRINKEQTRKVLDKINFTYYQFNHNLALSESDKLSVSYLVNHYYNQKNYDFAEKHLSKIYNQEFRIFKDVLGQGLDVSNKTARANIDGNALQDPNELKFRHDNFKDLYTILDSNDEKYRYVQKLFKGFDKELFKNSDILVKITNYQNKRIVNLDAISQLSNDNREIIVKLLSEDFSKSLTVGNVIDILKQSVEMMFSNEQAFNLIKKTSKMKDIEILNILTQLQGSFDKKNETTVNNLLTILDDTSFNKTITDFMMCSLKNILLIRNTFYHYPKNVEIIVNNGDLGIQIQGKYTIKNTLKHITKHLSSVPDYTLVLKKSMINKPEMNYVLNGKLVDKVIFPLDKNHIHTRLTNNLDFIKSDNKDKMQKMYDFAIKFLEQVPYQVTQPDGHFMKVLPQIVASLDNVNDISIKVQHLDKLSYDKDIQTKAELTYTLLTQIGYSHEVALQTSIMQAKFMDNTAKGQNIFGLSIYDKHYLRSLFTDIFDEYKQDIKTFDYQKSDDTVECLSTSEVHFVDPTWYLNQDQDVGAYLHYASDDYDFEAQIQHAIADYQTDDESVIKQMQNKLATYIANEDAKNGLNLTVQEYQALTEHEQDLYHAMTVYQTKYNCMVLNQDYHRVIPTLDTHLDYTTVKHHPVKASLDYHKIVDTLLHNQHIKITSGQGLRNNALMLLGVAQKKLHPEYGPDKIYQTLMQAMDNTIIDDDGKYANNDYANLKSKAQLICDNDYGISSFMYQLKDILHGTPKQVTQHRSLHDAKYLHYNEKANVLDKLVFADYIMMDHHMVHNGYAHQDKYSLELLSNLANKVLDTNYQNTAFTPSKVARFFKDVPEWTLRDIYQVACFYQDKPFTRTPANIKAFNSFMHIKHVLDKTDVPSMECSQDFVNFMNKTNTRDKQEYDLLNYFSKSPAIMWHLLNHKFKVTQDMVIIMKDQVLDKLIWFVAQDKIITLGSFKKDTCWESVVSRVQRQNTMT